jgi:hypothetical protein
MGWTDYNGWRIKTIIFMVVVLGSIYTINLFFMSNMQIPINNFDANGTNIPTTAPNAMQMFFGVLFFGYIQIGWIAFLFSVFTSCCWVVTGYVSYSFLKDFI